MGFSKSNAQSMRIEVKAALEAIERKYDCEVQIGTISYGDTLSMKLAFAKMSENEHGAFVMTKEAKSFINNAKRFGLSPDILGESIRYNGKTYVITGHNTRRSKYPISYTIDGKNYKSNLEGIKNIIRNTHPEFFI